jgi:hypothetical protein
MAAVTTPSALARAVPRTPTAHCAARVGARHGAPLYREGRRDDIQRFVPVGPVLPYGTCVRALGERVVDYFTTEHTRDHTAYYVQNVFPVAKYFFATKRAFDRLDRTGTEDVSRDDLYVRGSDLIAG